jgi:hypothetical protein
MATSLARRIRRIGLIKSDYIQCGDGTFERIYNTDPAIGPDDKARIKNELRANAYTRRQYARITKLKKK